MRLIGLHGLAGAGKDTVADMLARSRDVSRLALAGPIKDMLIAGLQPLGVTRQVLTDRTRKEQPLPGIGRSPRELMQTLGTEWGRSMAPDLWIRIAEASLVYYRKFATAVVITDVRFENEAVWIRRQGGEIWHIIRTLHANVHSLHASEAGIPLVPGVDSVIANDRGLEQLADEVLAAWDSERVITPSSAA